jgi:hypothetical protein
MPTFNRRIYQTQGLFVSPTATGQHFSSGNSGVNLVEQISRVQSINDGWELNRQGINQFAKLSPLSREIVDAPTVNLSFSYYVTDGNDEDKLGFVISGSGAAGALSDILNKTEAEKNYFIPTVDEGEDLAGQSGVDVIDVRAIGNGFVSAYTVDGSVGGFLTANVTVEASNAAYHLGGTGNPIPAVNPTNGAAINRIYSIPLATTGDVGQPTVIKQGDLTVDFGVANPLGATLTGVGGAHIQSFSLSLPLAREQLQKLGNRYAYDRPVTFPLDVTLSVSAFVNNLTTGNLADLFCGSNKYNINIFAKNTCEGNMNEMVYTLKGATLDSENFTSSIGPAQTVDLTFTASIGGPTDTSANVYFSGSAV